ncbi:hypothetical protein [Brucella sp. IR073]|uniref:hypothetical protein n=1 Tax=unclassified Brucella TaxID=2632610 RepID=UPI003B984BEC
MALDAVYSCTFATVSPLEEQIKIAACMDAAPDLDPVWTNEAVITPIGSYPLIKYIGGQSQFVSAGQTLMTWLLVVPVDYMNETITFRITRKRLDGGVEPHADVTMTFEIITLTDTGLQFDLIATTLTEPGKLVHLKAHVYQADGTPVVGTEIQFRGGTGMGDLVVYSEQSGSFLANRAPSNIPQETSPTYWVLPTNGNGEVEAWVTYNQTIACNVMIASNVPSQAGDSEMIYFMNPYDVEQVLDPLDITLDASENYTLDDYQSDVIFRLPAISSQYLPQGSYAWVYTDDIFDDKVAIPYHWDIADETILTPGLVIAIPASNFKVSTPPIPKQNVAFFFIQTPGGVVYGSGPSATFGVAGNYSNMPNLSPRINRSKFPGLPYPSPNPGLNPGTLTNSNHISPNADLVVARLYGDIPDEYKNNTAYEVYYAFYFNDGSFWFPDAVGGRQDKYYSPPLSGHGLSTSTTDLKYMEATLDGNLAQGYSYFQQRLGPVGFECFVVPVGQQNDETARIYSKTLWTNTPQIIQTMST